MLSIVIVTYRREQVLLDTIESLQPLRAALQQPSELLIIDQTELHQPSTQEALQRWAQAGQIRWLQLPAPHLTRAMNTGLLEAGGEIVLFLDDDVVPSPGLLQGHVMAYARFPDAWAVVGQVLQPGQKPENLPRKPHASAFWRDLDFPFHSNLETLVENAMGCNLSLKRRQGLLIGGFDENFPPPVAARFESEFAKRLVRAGGCIRFAPDASLRHLAVRSGGTRSHGSHLTSASSRYGVGDCYFALRFAKGWDRFWYLARKPFREVRTRFHLRHPWWIPVKLVGEIRALLLALRISRKSPALLIAPHD
ncbi:glycosyltransferase family 2 protein [Synechococcus sp. MW101C3]|uniref:glycosyltransferase family 2 protein n=1 Tax=Synechococcus sp. MW101C3 TaxID=210768 RepID=UPI000B99AADD|nr:glycosyltransferase [Synechococcus sp. MW101C3]